ncbi:MAG: helix-turn-helix transcriptional regulator [Candidimonas sp.]
MKKQRSRATVSPKEKKSTRHAALGDFLRNVRARVSPSEVGFPVVSRRRTPGLRREEVAQLCGISPAWYTRLEQGHEVSASASVWAQIADALRMSRAERRYLFELAEMVDPEREAGAPGTLRDGLMECVKRIQAAAYIVDPCWNVLACNDEFKELFGGWPKKKSGTNLLHFFFLDESSRTHLIDWESRAGRVTAEFRADVAPYIDEPAVHAEVDRLLNESPVFAYWWTRHTVVDRDGGLLRPFRKNGKEAYYRQFTFRLMSHPDCKLIVLMNDGSRP